ncbi:MAG: PAS domain-containing sensor histidine kinase [Marinilabiliaceae bacterium]|nr:PAS domain-containing sensor histidine kinase [Marinilabiliaceae bacterium]
MKKKIGKINSVLALFFFCVSILSVGSFVGQLFLLFSVFPVLLIVWHFALKYAIGAFVLIGIISSYRLGVESMFDFLGISYLLVSVGIAVGLYLLKRHYRYLHLKVEDLNRFKARQDTMLENSTDIMAIIDRDGLITYTSSNVKAHFGWIPKDVVGKEGWIAVHPDDLSKTKERFKSLLNHPSEIDNIDFRFKCADGTYKYVNLSAVNMLHDPIIKGILVNYRDIDQQKKTEQALLANEYKYRILFENMQDTICMLDKEGCITDINEAGIQLMGYSRQEIIGMKVAQLVHPEDREKSKKYFEELNNKGRYSRYEGRVVAKSGKPIWVQVDSSEFVRDGIKIGSQDIVRDISDQKEVEYKMRQQNKKLQELNVTKDKFFSIISHDLRSPFNSILGLTSLLDARYDNWDDKKKKEYIKRLKIETCMTYKLLDNLLEWASIQTQRMHFNPQKHLLQELVKDEICLLEELAANKNISVHRIACQEDYFVNADKNMISTVFRNLFSNAVKFTPENGSISISCQKHFVQDQKQYVQIAVTDSGVGIPAEQLQKLFKLQDLVSTKGTAGEIGTGLGLILCKEFIDKHGGILDVKSQKGQSSTFTVSLELI